MISYRIVSRLVPPSVKELNKKGARIDPKDPDFKFKIFQRIVSTTEWRKGQPIRVRGTSRKGIITKMHLVFDQVPKWEGKQPFFIEVTFSDGEVLLCAKSQLTAEGAK